jgi:hypothetical protein
MSMSVFESAANWRGLLVDFGGQSSSTTSKQLDSELPVQNLRLR